MPNGNWEMGRFNYPYRQVVDNESPEQGSYSASESSAQMLIDFDLTNSLIGESQLPGLILGYPIYNPDVSSRLSRYLPMRHPVNNRLWAARIVSMRGRPNDAGQSGQKVTDAVSGMSYFKYNVQRCMIQFSCPPYAVLTDNQVESKPSGEFYRFVDKNADFTVENITKQGNSFRWARVIPTTLGTGGLPPGTAANSTIPLGFIVRSGKALLKWTWHQVPAQALFGTDGTRVPANILDAVGKVNNAYFPNPNDTDGFPPGTLLFLPPKFIPEDAPVEPQNMGIPLGYPPRTYKVEMAISYFNPATYPNWNGANGYPWKGHLLAPSPVYDAMPYFYLIVANDFNTPDTKSFLYQSYAFGNIFILPEIT